MALYKYRPERIHTRMSYVQYIYINRGVYSAFELFSFPIVIYARDGVVAAANRMFRDFTEIKDDDIRLGKINIFDYIDNSNDGLDEAVRMAFSGVPNVYISDTRIMRAEADTPEDRLLRKHPNAIFYPVTCDREGIRLVGILLDTNYSEIKTKSP